MITDEEKRKLLKDMENCVITSHDDPEVAHLNADNILLEILTKIGGFDEIVKDFNDVEKWYA